MPIIRMPLDCNTELIEKDPIKNEGTEKVLPSFLRENICTYLTICLVLCRYFSILCATNSDCHVITATRFYTQPLHRSI